MDNLPFENEELDLIWPEGAIYNIGFERGLTEWRNFIKKGWLLGCNRSIVAYTRSSCRNRAVRVDAYPEIDNIPNKIAIMQKPDIFPSHRFYYRKTAGLNIFMLHKFLHINFLWKSMQVT